MILGADGTYLPLKTFSAEHGAYFRAAGGIESFKIGDQWSGTEVGGECAQPAASTKSLRQPWGRRDDPVAPHSSHQDIACVVGVMLTIVAYTVLGGAQGVRVDAGPHRTKSCRADGLLQPLADRTLKVLCSGRRVVASRQ